MLKINVIIIHSENIYFQAQTGGFSQPIPIGNTISLPGLTSASFAQSASDGSLGLSALSGLSSQQLSGLSGQTTVLQPANQLGSSSSAESSSM